MTLKKTPKISFIYGHIQEFIDDFRPELIFAEQRGPRIVPFDFCVDLRKKPDFAATALSAGSRE